ncbi:glycoside hydrolase family 2 TIM barrel-domain containing protein [Halosimplex amylolyticum]|uniref:glycoside hydrolase family 2 protein n=1 Tax=Halosimplex amylolyticum TaxID=3396616 RepID=UPI003F57ED96
MSSQSCVSREPICLTPLPESDAVVSLSGSWRFTAAPPTEPPASEADWRTHEVPGLWSAHGFEVDEDAGEVGWYRREFRVPTGRAGRTKLRFGAVYSRAVVWVNGERVGDHEGGYTPFEVDVTDAVSSGENRVSVAVRESSRAADLDWGNVTGGITRDVTMFSVPDVHAARYHVETDLGDESATVRALLTVVNEGAETASGPSLDLSVTGPDGQPVTATERSLEDLGPGASRELVLELAVDDTQRWTPESPSLYTVHCGVAADGNRVESVRRTGIREVGVTENEICVNGTPVTLRGVNWEEVDPDRGALVSAARTRRDAERLRKANVNYVRTHTQPPTEAFLDACDELGILVQVELPFTFLRNDTADRADDAAYRETMVETALETVARDRSHPSVFVWSLANESEWGENFEAVAEAVAAADPTRLRTFNWAEYRDEDAHRCSVGNHHYPEMRVPGSLTAADFEDGDRPVLFDEFAHVYCYNHRELATDPGLRDDWGRFFEPIWETVRAADSVAGGAVFAGIDHAHPEFRWGILDAHRRERPEYWHLRKVYAPVRATVAERAADGLVVELANRRDFESLADCRIEWDRGSESGTVVADIPPGERGDLAIPVAPTEEEHVELRVVDGEGFVLDEYRFAGGDLPSPPADLDAGTVSAGAGGTDGVRDGADGGAGSFVLDAGAASWSVDGETGRVAAPASRGSTLDGVPTPVLTPLEAGRTGEHREAEPFDGRVDDWTVDAVAIADGQALRLEGTGDAVDARVTLRPATDGWVRLSYDLSVTADRSAREVGIALDLAPDFETLSWERDARWTVYPDDHVGRPEGVAEAFPSGERPGDRERDFTLPWSRDATPRGSNDFRSAKRNVRRASLTDGESGLELRAGGDAHLRAAVTGDAVRLFVLARSLAGSGGEWFDRNATVGEDPGLAAGDSVSGCIDLRIVE